MTKTKLNWIDSYPNKEGFVRQLKLNGITQIFLKQIKKGFYELHLLNPDFSTSCVKSGNLGQVKNFAEILLQK